MYKFNGFTNEANEALNCAIETAGELGHNYIGSEHILYGIANSADTVASDVLDQCGVTSEKLQNFAALGLFLFVAVPLPGTGAWVGSLIANFLDMPPKKAIPPIIAGVFAAGIIVLTLTAIANGGIQYLLQRG